MALKTKQFKCMDVKRAGALSVYNATKNMSLTDELRYWAEREEAARVARAKAGSTIRDHRTK